MRCATLVGTANDVEPNQAHTKLYGSACMLCLTARVRHCQVHNHYLSVLSLCCFDKNNDAVENVCKGHVNHHYMPLPLCCKGFGCCRRHQHPQATIKTLRNMELQQFVAWRIVFGSILFWAVILKSATKQRRGSWKRILGPRWLIRHVNAACVLLVYNDRCLK